MSGSTRPQSEVDTRKLSEVARHVVVPSGIEMTGWPPVYKRIREFGDVFDQWQCDVGSLVLGKRANGEHAATVGGVTVSIARQVAKTFMFGRIVFALCTLFPDLTVIWTAHRTRTSDETFRKLSSLCKRASIAKYIEGKPREANGQQEIRFKNGSRILFGAREGGFGRGFDEVDILVFDEAQILSEKALEDMVAATNQSRWDPGALVLFMGTPPRPIDPGEAFTNRRLEALRLRDGKEFGEPTVGEDAIYIEASADRNGGLDDRNQWKLGNPSFPNRTPERSMLRLRKNLPSDDSWRREGLGVWDSQVKGKPKIKAEAWDVLRAEDRPDGRLVVGVKFSPDGVYAALAVAVRPSEKDVPIHVDGLRVASTGEGVAWIVQWLKERETTVSQVIVDGKGWAPVLVDQLDKAGFQANRTVQKDTSRFLRLPSTQQVIEAHSMFLDAVQDENLTHGDSETLSNQVAEATTRKIGTAGGWGWAALTESGSTVLLDAVTFAFWGAKTVTRDSEAKQRTVMLA